MIKNMQEMIDQTQYWDLQILDFSTNFFGDEVNIFIYKDTVTSWKISFLSCYKVTYETDAAWRKNAYVKELKKPQLGYYGQDITIRESDEIEGFYDVSIDLTILVAKIICKEINVKSISNDELTIFWK